mgnify:CR=1 FL=1
MFVSMRRCQAMPETLAIEQTVNLIPVINKHGGFKYGKF